MLRQTHPSTLHHSQQQSNYSNGMNQETNDNNSSLQNHRQIQIDHNNRHVDSAGASSITTTDSSSSISTSPPLSADYKRFFCYSFKYQDLPEILNKKNFLY